MVDIDNNFDFISKNQIIIKYIENVNKLKSQAISKGFLTENEFNCRLLSQFSRSNCLLKITQIIPKFNITIIISIFLVCLLLYKHETSSFFLRNIQTSIYPGMKLWRKLTLPVISQYPSLTGMDTSEIRTSSPFR